MLEACADFYNDRFTVMWESTTMRENGIVGYPLGAGPTLEKAVDDLVRRTNMESKTSFCSDQVAVRVRA